MWRDGGVETPTGLEFGGARFYLDEEPPPKPPPSTTEQSDPVVVDDLPQPHFDQVRVEVERTLETLQVSLVGDLDPGETDLERSVRLEGEHVALGDVVIPTFGATTVDGRELTTECSVISEDDLTHLVRTARS